MPFETNGKRFSETVLIDPLTGLPYAATGGGGGGGTVPELAIGLQTFNYNPDGTLNYVDMVVSGTTYRQTYSYSGGKVSQISAWVAQ